MKTVSLNGLGCFAVILTLSLENACGQTSPVEEQFAGWPAGWVDAYKRFENFIRARSDDSWPRSDLQVSDTGIVTHGVRIAETVRENLSLTTFKHGRNILTSGHVEGDILGGFGPGSYTSCLYVSTQAGFQYLYPMVRFEVLEGGNNERSRNHLRILPPVAQPETRWPNERLLLFLDFHIFPKHYPSDIGKRNRRVDPAIALRIHNSGIVEREKLADETAERLLQWRIYHDGKLVERGSAAGITRLEPNFGSGNFQVLVGVEGPTGFMPVSNLLEFPLFPSAAGKLSVIPPDEDKDGTPDFLSTLSREGKLRFEEPDEGDTDGDGIPDREEASGKVSMPGAAADEATKRLIELWQTWNFDLKNRPPIAPKETGDKVIPSSPKGGVRDIPR